MIVLTLEERTLAANVRRLMAERDWSIRKLAEKCKMPHPTLQSLLEERSSPRVGTLCVLARVFELSEQTLLSKPDDVAQAPSRRQKRAS